MLSTEEMGLVRRHARVFERVRSVIKQISSSRSLDDELYTAFRSRFPSVDVRDLAGAQSVMRNKAAWDSLHAQFEGRIDEPTAATIHKLDIARGLTVENIVLVGRLVWMAIEVCRLRERTRS